MFDLEFSKLLVIGVIALLVIKPKDLPKALRTLGYWVRHARQVAAEFQSSLEQLAREAELADVKKDIEDATRQVTADIHSSIDPVEVEKLFNPPEETTIHTPSIASPSAAPAEPAVAAPPTDEEPTLPFPEPLPETPRTHAPALEPAEADGKPGPHDHV